MNFWSNWVYPSQVHEERVSLTKRTRTCEEETARETKTSKQGLWPKAVPVSAGVYFGLLFFRFGSMNYSWEAQCVGSTVQLLMKQSSGGCAAGKPQTLWGWRPDSGSLHCVCGSRITNKETLPLFAFPMMQDSGLEQDLTIILLPRRLDFHFSCLIPQFVSEPLRQSEHELKFKSSVHTLV